MLQPFDPRAVYRTSLVTATKPRRCPTSV